jgi:hypothetical protein
LKAVCKKYKRGGIVMRKLVRIAVALVIIIGTVPGIASAKTLYVVAEDTISNDTQTPADAFAVDVKVLTYNNQCMTLTFSSAAAVNGVSPGNIGFLPEIDGMPALPTQDGNGTVYWIAGELDYWDMAGFTWYQCGLNKGKHTVAIRYYPTHSGNKAFIGARLLKIDLTAGKIVPPQTTAAELEDE